MASSSGSSSSSNPPVVPLSPTRIRLEAKRLLDVCLEAKISDGTIRSLLDNVSTEFSAFHDSEDSSREGTDDSDGRDSPQLSLSESQDVEANRAKKELLIKILSAQISTTAARSGDAIRDSSIPMASAMPSSTFVSTASQASTIDPMRNPFPISSSDTGSLGGTGSFVGTTTAFYAPSSGMMMGTSSSGMEGRSSHTSTVVPSLSSPTRNRNVSSGGGMDLDSHKKLADANDTIGLLSAELDRHRRIAESTMEGENIERRAMEERCKRMTAMLEAESTLRRQYEDKAKQHDKMSEDVVRLQQENHGLRETMEQQGKALHALTESEKVATTTAADSNKTRDLLLMDKQFLQQELRAAEARVDEKARLMESYQSKALAMETKAGQLTGTHSYLC